jgi:hypothetical protein
MTLLTRAAGSSAKLGNRGTSGFKRIKAGTPSSKIAITGMPANTVFCFAAGTTSTMDAVSVLVLTWITGLNDKFEIF